MNGPQTLLLVDDDVGLQQTISAYLTAHGYIVRVASNANAMDDLIRQQRPGLIILDVMLPGEDGLSICRRLNDANGPPVIMASAAGGEIDRILGLELGADDFLPKPFSPRELLARVRAVLRRCDDAEVAGAGRADSFYVAGFVYDPVLRRLKAPSGASVILTAGESAVLGLLLSRNGEIVTRESLADLVQDMGQSSPAQSRSLDLQVSRLRKKLAMHGGAHIIATERGSGYSIACEIRRQ